MPSITIAIRSKVLSCNAYASNAWTCVALRDDGGTATSHLSEVKKIEGNGSLEILSTGSNVKIEATAFTSDDVNVPGHIDASTIGVSGLSSASEFIATKDSASDNDAITVLSISRTVAGAAGASSVGARIEIKTEDSGGSLELAASIDGILSSLMVQRLVLYHFLQTHKGQIVFVPH